MFIFSWCAKSLPGSTTHLPGAQQGCCEPGSGQRERLRGLMFRRSQVFSSMEKLGLDSQLRKNPITVPSKTSASDLRGSRGKRDIKCNGDLFHNGLFPPKTRLIIRSPGISSGPVGTTNTVIQIQLWIASKFWRSAKALVRLSMLPSSPLTAPQKTPKGPEKWSRSVDYHPPPSGAKCCFCTGEHRQVRPHTTSPWEQHTFTRADGDPVPPWSSPRLSPTDCSAEREGK